MRTKHKKYIEKQLFSKSSDIRWAKRYLNFLEKFQIRDGVFEKHHILSRAEWPEHIDDNWNLVKITPRAHFIAHYMLYKAMGTPSACYAFQMMKRGTEKSKLYEKAKLDYIKFVREMKWFINDETGEVIYRRVNPGNGWRNGHNFECRPEKVFWATDPESGNCRRFRSLDEVPDEWRLGRNHDVTTHLNKGKAKVIDLKKKIYKLVDYDSDEYNSWYNVHSSGDSLEKRLVVEFNGKVFITRASCPDFIKVFLCRKKHLNMLEQPVAKPHPNMKTESFEFHNKHYGKTYGESGIRVTPFLDFNFNETMEIIH